jgi:hypothetical protein
MPWCLGDSLTLAPCTPVAPFQSSSGGRSRPGMFSWTFLICSSCTHLLAKPLPGLDRPQPGLVHRNRPPPLCIPCSFCSWRYRISLVAKTRPVHLHLSVLHCRDSKWDLTNLLHRLSVALHPKRVHEWGVGEKGRWDHTRSRL